MTQRGGECWRIATLLPAVALLAGCEALPAPGLAPLKEPAVLQPAAARVSGTVPAKHGPHRVFETRGRTVEAAALPPTPPAGPGEKGDVTLNFVDADIREVARVILGSTLKLNYTIDPSVHGTATLDTGTPMPRAALLPALETVLNQNGATLIRRNGLYAVVPIGAAVVTNTAGTGSTGTGAEVVALRYASAKDLAKVLEPYVGEGSKLAAEPGRNALIVSGDKASRETLISLIRAFDIDALAGQSFAIFPSDDGDATKTAGEIEKALRAENGGPLGELVRVVPLPRANAVLIASGQQHYIDAAKRLFRLTSVAADATARTWHVYYVQNGQSADLENLLQRAFTPGHVTPTLPGTTAPGAEPVTMGGAFGQPAAGVGAGQRGPAGLSGLGASPMSAGATAAPGAPAEAGATLAAATAPAQAPGGRPPAAEPLSTEAGAAGEEANRIRILADRRNNALLIYATPREYSMIDGMLRKIDVVPLEVLIDATIAEVTLNNELQYGTQFFFKLNHIAENLGPIPQFPPTPLPPTGLVGFAISKTPHFILQALADVTKVKVLSAPQVLVMDNQPARLQVGQQVPILTGTATSTLAAGAPIVNSIDYHSTGVIMQVTPRINSGGLVTLDIAQEVSDVAPPAANTATGSPTFDDRLLRTRVAIQNGQTVALAGLIRDNTTDDNNGIPFLKDIPVLSTLFSSQNSSRTRTELLVLITPHVVHDQRDARALTEDLRQHLINAALVPQEMTRQPIRGLADPNRL